MMRQNPPRTQWLNPQESFRHQWDVGDDRSVNPHATLEGEGDTHVDRVRLRDLHCRLLLPDRQRPGELADRHAATPEGGEG